MSNNYHWVNFHACEIGTLLHEKTTLIISLILISLSQLKAQSFTYGVSFGSAQFLHQNGSKNYDDFTFSLANIKLGKQINSKHAVVLYLPEILYQYKESGGIRNRGFEAILRSLQYQNHPKLSCLTGLGLGMNAPAFMISKMNLRGNSIWVPQPQAALPKNSLNQKFLV